MINKLEFEELEVPKPPAEKRSKVLIALSLACILLLMALAMITLLKPQITGFTVNDEIAKLPSYSQGLDIETDKDLEYNLKLEDIELNEIENFTIRALAISGKYKYNESQGIDVKVYIQDSEGNNYSLLNEDALEAFKPEEQEKEEEQETETSPTITGMAVDDSEDDGDGGDGSENDGEKESSEDSSEEETGDEEEIEKEEQPEEEIEPSNETEPEEEIEPSEEENVTEEVEENITEEGIENATEENVTEEENITEEINATEINETALNETAINETINETALNESLLNETVINETKEITIRFKNICVETCDLELNGTNYKLIIELDSGQLAIDKIKYWLELNITNITIEYELIEDDESFDVIIDSTSYNNKTSTLEVVFHHNAAQELPIYIETEATSLSYDLSQATARGGENITLKVYNWSSESPEQYFEIKVGKESEVVGFGQVPEYNFNVEIKDAKNETVEAEIEFLKADKSKHKGFSRDKSLKVKKGNYGIKIKPNKSPIKEIVIENVEINSDSNEFVKIDDVNETGELASYLEVYAIDLLNFTSATVTAIAKGSQLYKCKDWSFEVQRCKGNWTLLSSLVPGQEYNFTLTPGDPGVGEGGDKNIVINTKDSKNNNIKTTLNLYDSNGALIKSLKTPIVPPGLLVANNVYTIEVVPDNHTVKAMRFAINVTGNISATLKLDKLEGKGKWAKHFALDPTQLNFSNASITTVAEGRDLFKCTDWDAVNLTCKGRWKKIADFLPGQEYNISITAEDPGFGENNKRVNLLDKEKYLLDYNETVLTTENNTSNVLIVPEDSKVKQIEVKKVKEDDVKNDLIIINETNETWANETLVIDTVELAAENVTATVTVVPGSKNLLKCELWDNSTESCQDEELRRGWKKEKDISETDQNVTLAAETPGKSAWGLSADEVILLDKDLRVLHFDEKVVAHSQNPKVKDVHIELLKIRPEKIRLYSYNNSTEDNELFVEYIPIATYSINPENLSFDYAEVNAIATGKDLFKCADFNFSTQTCYGRWKKLRDLKPGLNYNFTLTKQDPSFTETTKIITLIDSSDSLLDYNETVLAKASGLIDIEITPESSAIDKIVIYGHNESTAINDLKIDSPNSTTFLKSYSIDSEGLDFNNASVSVTATGNVLYKCKDWNFTTQSCYGNWTKLMDITPGQNYSFTLTPGDPGYGEANETGGACGDGSCSDGETCATCPADCGSCPSGGGGGGGSLPVPGCTESWICTAWSECITNVKTRTCTDQNNCGTTTQKPPTQESCTFPLTIPEACVEEWKCTNWSECSAEGIQTRTCQDLNDCGTEMNKPAEIQACALPVQPSCYDGIQNQGELGIDCGGPCEKQCEEKTLATMLTSVLRKIITILGNVVRTMGHVIGLGK